MNIISLLPATTEIVCALGMEDHLKGRSHECDFPETVTLLPSVTSFSTSSDVNSTLTNESIRNILKHGLSPFDADPELLKKLKPDFILTQDHCDVCAISQDQLRLSAKEFLSGSDTEIISVSPTDLKGIFESIRIIGQAIDVSSRAEALITEIKERLDIIKSTVSGEVRPGVATIEWLDPLMTAGNWVPEIIEIAGGEDLMGTAGSHSPWISWLNILDTDPDVLLIMPCGYDIQASLNEIYLLSEKKEWQSLTSVQNHKVYVLDGNQFFNRPGPRILESARIIAEILHPRLFKPLHKNSGWVALHDIIPAVQDYRFESS